VTVTNDPQDINVMSQWRIGDDETAAEIVAGAQMDALKPLAPVHLRARRREDGILISFIRRTRIGGDSWDSAEVPLNEEFERYRLFILSSSGTVKRIVETEKSEFLYTNADERIDFGVAQTVLQVRIAQLSHIADEGFATTTRCLIA